MLIFYFLFARGRYPRADLIKLGPGNHHVAEVAIIVRLIKDLLGQKVLVALVEVVFCLDLGCELAVESVVHHPPWNTLRNHKWDSVLMETVRLKRLKHWFEKRFLAEV